MNRIFKTSLVLIFFSFSLLLFQISCDNEAEANPSLSNEVKPLNLLYYFKFGNSGERELWTANYDGSGQRALLVLPSGLSFFGDFVQVSPDGKTIFFTLFETNQNIELLNIYSVNADGTGLKKVISASGESSEVLLAGVW